MLRNTTPVSGYEEFYSMTKSGRIWSHRKNREIFPSIDKSAVKFYYRITLTDGEGVAKKWYYHRLVAMTFHKKRRTAQKLEINHIDYNTLNNRASNLEWVTRSENILYSVPRRKNLKANRAKKAAKANKAK